MPRGAFSAIQSLEGLGLFPGWSPWLPPLALTRAASGCPTLPPLHSSCLQVNVHGFMVRQAPAQLPVCFQPGLHTVCDCPWAAHGFTDTQNTRAEETQLLKLGGGRQGQEWSGSEKPQFPAFREFK